MTTSFWLHSMPFSLPDLSTDIIIVGGGFVGLSTAYWLSELNPNLKIVVLDRGQLGAGASGRNAGFLTKGSAYFYKSLGQKWGVEGAQSILKFAEESLKLVYDHFLKTSSSIDFIPTTSMTLFKNEKLHQDLDFDAKSFGFEWRNESELPENLRSKFYGGLETSPEYKVTPVHLLEALKQKLEARKIKVLENVSAFKVTPDGVMTDSFVLRGKKVILALNGYFPQFHEVFKPLIIPHRAQMLAVELEKDFNCPSLYYDPPERVYWRKVHDRTIIFGGKRLLDEKGEVGDFEKISPLIQAGLESYVGDLLGLKYKVLHRWSGTMGFTDHELPILKKISAPIETYVVGGFSGHGMGLGFRSALEMAQLVTGQKQTSFFQTFKDNTINL